MSRVWIGLGANLGDRGLTLERAVELLAERGVTVLRRSRLYESRPEGGEPQPPYLNGVLEGETALSPPALLRQLQGIESALGRPARHRPGPRTCDLDLLAYDDLVVEGPELTLPHPRLALRSFVLVPLCEIDVNWMHPACGRTAGELLAALPFQPGEIGPAASPSRVVPHHSTLGVY